MSNYVAIRNGGATDEQGALRFLRRLSSNDQGPARSGDLKITPHATPNNSVDVQVGDVFIAYQGYGFYAWADAINVLTVTANSSGNPRIDSAVAYIDLAVVSSVSNDNPGALKFILVPGTPAGSPAAPNSTVIQAAVGAGNPYLVRGNVNVPNGFTSGSQILNSGTTIIVDVAAPFIIGSNPKFGFFIPDLAFIANDLSWNPIAIQGQSLQGIIGYAKNGPTGSSLAARIFNITQGLEVGTVTLAAGAQFALTTSLVTATVNALDVFRADVTAIGSTTPGNDISLIAF